MRFAAVFAVFMIEASACLAQTRPPQTVVRTVVSGKQSQVGFLYALNPDCSNAGEVDVRILKKPEHGTIEITQGDGFPNYPETNIRFQCNKQKVPGSLVMYKSDDGYVGKDFFETEHIGPLGGDFINKYVVTVK
jgi:hypothetical protein